ncbi:MAG: hypothetical protein AABY14_02290 [Nanoarchaeota archaeon]
MIPIFLFISFSIFNQNAYSANCWLYTSNTTCTTGNGCIWKTDGWGSWCEELNCWSLNTQNLCQTTAVPGKNCTWSGGSETFTCEDISCWSFSGTSQSNCVNNSANLSCSWSDFCYSVGSADCYSKTTQSTCLNTTGCGWGQCSSTGCWQYSSTQSSCEVGRDYRGKFCVWSSSSNYCRENQCWDMSLYSNETSCNSASGINCEWKWNSCQEKSCYSFDFTNASACVNNTAGLSCVWSGSYCNQDSCWSATTNTTCSARSKCNWKSYKSSGWCEEVNCWTWDSSRGGSQSACENNATNYGLACSWFNNWCQKDISSVKCSNITTERACMDTYYCWWEYGNFNNISAGGTCKEPSWGTGNFSAGNILNEWNPGCYIFDTNETQCNKTLGCEFTNSKCNTKSDSYGQNITSNGIVCAYINDSDICSNIPVLSSCCSWVNGSCTKNSYSTSCVNQLAQTPNGENSCDDANTKSNCDKIAGSPWYMPCKWDNTSSTAKCVFKAIEVFGNTTQSLVKIENKKNCESAGGKWITENYCEGNVSVPTGRCEYKFDEEENCDKACFACENKDSNGNTVNATNAESSCIGSKLGFCGFVPNINAPNKIAFCKAKDEWKKGIAGDCDVQTDLI